MPLNACFRCWALTGFLVVLGVRVGIRAQGTPECDSLEVQYRATLETDGDAAALPLCKALQDCILKAESDSSLRYAVALRWEGNREYGLGHLSRANRAWEKSLKVLQSQGRTGSKAYSSGLNNLAVGLCTSGDFSAAAQWFDQSLALDSSRSGVQSDAYLEKLDRAMGTFEDFDADEWAQSYRIQMDAVLAAHHPDKPSRRANGLLAQAKHHAGLGDYRSALQCIGLAEDVASEAFGSVDFKVLRLKVWKAHFLQKSGDHEAAATTYRYIAESADSGTERGRKLQLSAWNGLKKIHRSRCEMEGEVTCLRKMEEIHCLEGGSGDYDCLKARVQRLHVEPISRESKCTEYRVLLEEIGSSEGRKWSEMRGLCHYRLGLSLEALGLYAEALEHVELARSEFEVGGALTEVRDAETWNAMGTLCTHLGLHDEALLHFRTSLDIKEKSDVFGPLDVMRALTNLAVTHQQVGELDRARALYGQSRDVAASLPESQQLNRAQWLSNYGAFLVDLGEYREAEQAYREALAIREQWGGDSGALSASLNNLASLASREGNAQRALEHLKRAQDLLEADATRDVVELARVRRNMAMNLHALGDAGAAKSMARQAMGLLPAGSVDLVGLHGLLGAISEDSDTALFHLNEQHRMLEALHGADSRHPDFMHCLNNIASEYNDSGDFEQGYFYILKALDVAQAVYGKGHPHAMMCLKNLAINRYRAGEVEEALRLQSEYFDWYFGFTAQQSLGLSRVEMSLNWDRSLGAVNTALFMAADSKRSMGERMAFDVLLARKGLALDTFTELDQSIRSSGDSVSVAAYESLQSLRRQVHRLQAAGGPATEWTDLMGRAETLEKQLYRDVEGFKDRSSGNKTGWKQVQKALEKTEVAVEFGSYFNSVSHRTHHFALVLRGKSKGPELIPLCTGADIDLGWDSLSFGRLDVEESYGVIDADLERLHEVLWAPLESTLDSGQTVYYSGSGILNQLPFHAMYRTDAEGQRSYVMDRYDLRPLSTTRLVAEGRHAGADAINGPLLSLGGVDYNDIPDVPPSGLVSRDEAVAFERTRSQMEGARGMSDFMPFGPLVGTLKEVQGINQQWRDAGMQVDQLGGSAASEHALKARLEEEIPAVLHIATHGFAFPDPFEEEDLGAFDQPEFRTYFRVGEDPLGRVGLILAGGNQSWVGRSDTMLAATGEDGILTAAEIADMDLRGMGLVVLSACETGLGELDGMEGTMGLFRAFKLAGVENVVQSFWSVPDKETQELMAAFYSRLTAGEDPQSAFSGAQKAMRHRYPNDPAKWAAFTLVR